MKKVKSYSARGHRKKASGSRKRSTEPTGLIASSAIACGIGLLCGIAAALIFSLIALLCGLGTTLISVLGYCAAGITFAVCGYVAGKRGRAALPAGILTGCAMTLISILLSLLPLSSSSGLPPVADILIRIGFIAITLIFSIIGSN